MNRSFYPRSLALTLVLSSAALVLSGCGGVNVTFPDSVAALQVQGPPIVGSAFGGHAPIVGSHVYLLQPGTSGIGSQATSILGTGTSTSPGGFPLHTNPPTSVGPPPTVSDPNIPAGWQYVITDAQGGFNLTNAYTCVSGQPVYIYLTGGNPGTVANSAIVLLAVLGNCPTSGALNFGGSSSNPINFVFVNEVSTVAAGYVFQPFTSAASNTAVDIGSTGTTQGLVGIENAAATAAQLYAIQGNATLSTSNDGEGHIANFQTQAFSGTTGTPNQGNGVVPQATIDTLANILAACVDGSTGAASTTCTTLFSNATDNGLLLGTQPTDTATAAINIARYPAGNHSSTTNVNTSFVANIFGVPSGAVPFTPSLANPPNDFTIVINYPTTAVYRGSTAINSTLGRAESIAVDALGQIWITAQTNEDAVRWSSLGIQNSENISPAAGQNFGYVSIDGANNAWTGIANGTSGIQIAGANGVFTKTYGANYTNAYTVVTDKAGDAYFFAGDSGTVDGPTYNTNGIYQMWEYGSGGSLLSNSTANCNGLTGPFVFNCISGFIISAGDRVSHAAIESTAKGGHLWVTSENGPGYQIARITPTGGKDFSFTTNTRQPEFPSIDRNGNAWIANQAVAGSIYKITTKGTSPFYTSTVLTSASTKATLTMPFGSAVDGNNNIWIANRCDLYSGTTADCALPLPNAGSNSIVVINGANNLAISPTTNYIPEAQYPATAAAFTPILSDSLNIAIDPSGNVWVTNYFGNSVAEIVGAAAPVVTPLSLAAGNNMIGVAP